MTNASACSRTEARNARPISALARSRRRLEYEADVLESRFPDLTHEPRDLTVRHRLIGLHVHALDAAARPDLGHHIAQGFGPYLDPVDEDASLAVEGHHRRFSR